MFDTFRECFAVALQVSKISVEASEIDPGFHKNKHYLFNPFLDHIFEKFPEGFTKEEVLSLAANTNVKEDWLSYRVGIPFDMTTVPENLLLKESPTR